jgi:hypothetical protein
MKSTYKSLRHRVAEKQKQLQRAQALCQRLDDQLFALRERMWQTEQGAQLRKEECLRWLEEWQPKSSTQMEDEIGARPCKAEHSESPVDISRQSR